MSLDVDSFMEEINRHVSSSGILTYLSERGSEAWDVRKDDGKLFFGKNKSQNSHFRSVLSRTISASRIVSITLRSLTPENDPASGLPIRELRGYLLSVENNSLKWYMVDAEDLMESHYADRNTGERDEIERALVFCGPNGRCIDNNGLEILMVTIGHKRGSVRGS